MIPNGRHVAMNGFAPNGGPSLGSLNHNQDFGPSLQGGTQFNPNIQMQQQRQHHPSPPVTQQNAAAAQWQQAQMAMLSNMQMPLQNTLPQNSKMDPISWGSQMPQAQQMQNTMLQMPPFNMSLLQQQIMQEAFAMSQPVGASDEPTLLTTLLKAKRANQNFKEALNGLHALNNHSASLWKDYYLEHKDRFDDWIQKCIKKEQADGVTNSETKRPNSTSVEEVRKQSVATAKKPSPASFRREVSPPVASSSRHATAPAVKQLPKKVKKPTPPVRDLPPTVGRRSTMNSLSVPDPVFDSRLPAPNASIKIPRPPSRSPSPPTSIVPRARGNKYTQEDRDFFINFIGWRLKQDPSLNRNELCAMLAEKAPHHTAQSWGSYWSNNHDLPDKVFSAAKGGLHEYLSGDEQTAMKKQILNYKDPSTSEEEDSDSEDDDDDDDDDDTPLRRYAAEEMTQGGTFNEADMYNIAKYIVSCPDWDSMTNKEKWGNFHAKHPQRSDKSWQEYHRRYGRDITKMVKKIRMADSIDKQRARPSSAIVNRKRKFEDGREIEPLKRGKIDV